MGSNDAAALQLPAQQRRASPVELNDFPCGSIAAIMLAKRCSTSRYVYVDRDEFKWVDHHCSDGRSLMVNIAPSDFPLPASLISMEF